MSLRCVLAGWGVLGALLTLQAQMDAPVTASSTPRPFPPEDPVPQRNSISVGYLRLTPPKGEPAAQGGLLRYDRNLWSFGPQQAYTLFAEVSIGAWNQEQTEGADLEGSLWEFGGGISLDLFDLWKRPVRLLARGGGAALPQTLSVSSSDFHDQQTFWGGYAGFGVQIFLTRNVSLEVSYSWFWGLDMLTVEPEEVTRVSTQAPKVGALIKAAPERSVLFLGVRADF